MASNGIADTPQVLHSVSRPSLMGAEEGSPKRGASEAKAPQGHRREPFLRNFLGEQKVPRRRQNARRAEKPGPQAQREQRPEGKKKRFQKRPGPQAQEKTMPGGRKEMFSKKARAAGPKKHYLSKNEPNEDSMLM